MREGFIQQKKIFNFGSGTLVGDKLHKLGITTFKTNLVFDGRDRLDSRGCGIW